MVAVVAAVVVLVGAAQVTLLSRFNGVGYTFVLAGFLKIMTVGGLTLSAPTDVARTAFGKATPYLMVPVGLGLCWIAKQVRAASRGCTGIIGNVLLTDTAVRPGTSLWCC